jgi:glutaredoxin
VIVVYSRPHRPPCTGTYRARDNASLTCRVVDATADAHQSVLELGYRGSPVVGVSGHEHWSGHGPEERVLRAFASESELREAGRLTRRGRLRRRAGERPVVDGTCPHHESMTQMPGK